MLYTEEKYATLSLTYTLFSIVIEALKPIGDNCYFFYLTQSYGTALCILPSNK